MAKAKNESTKIIRKILIGFAAFLGVLFLIGFVKGFSGALNTSGMLSKAKNQANPTQMDYFNSSEKVKFKYPSDWQVTYQDDTSPIKMIIAKGKIAEFKYISEPVKSSVNFDSYTKDSMSQIKEVPGFQLKSESDVVIDEKKFHRIEYGYTINGQSFTTLQLWTIANSTGYGFSYTAQRDEYVELLPVAEQILSTIEIY